MENFTFNDVFTNSFLASFQNTISLPTAFVALTLAAIFSIIIFIVYKITTKSVIYSRKFNVTMALMSVITAAMILSIQSNIVISLGMVGALSIVRFRTAIKEPRDLLFLFWSITNGIIIGAGVYSIALALAVILATTMLILDIFPTNKLPYLLVINLRNTETEDSIVQYLKNMGVSYNLKSRNASKERLDLVFEISNSTKDKNDIFRDIIKMNNVTSANLLSQDAEGQF